MQQTSSSQLKTSASTAKNPTRPKFSTPKGLTKLDWFSFGIVIFLTLHMVTTTFIAPAAAIFFGLVEEWMISSFPEAADGIPIVFNVLRAFFVIYLGVSLVKVANALREGEEFLSVARSPLLVVLVVAMGDIIASLIIA